MSLFQIESSRIKTIRKGRKIGRPKLAKLVGVTERELAKMEQSTSGAIIEEDALFRFADALGVPAPILTGDLALEDSDLQPRKVSTCTSGCCG